MSMLVSFLLKTIVSDNTLNFLIFVHIVSRLVGNVVAQIKRCVLGKMYLPHLKIKKDLDETFKEIKVENQNIKRLMVVNFIDPWILRVAEQVFDRLEVISLISSNVFVDLVVVTEPKNPLLNFIEENVVYFQI